MNQIYEPAAEDTLKIILGGDTTNAKVKYGSDTVIIQRTPVIILANIKPFPKNNAFTSRIIEYT